MYVVVPITMSLTLPWPLSDRPLAALTRLETEVDYVALT
jgi:hypothetical protein